MRSRTSGIRTGKLHIPIDDGYPVPLKSLYPIFDTYQSKKLQYPEKPLALTRTRQQIYQHRIEVLQMLRVMRLMGFPPLMPYQRILLEFMYTQSQLPSEKRVHPHQLVYTAHRFQRQQINTEIVRKHQEVV